MAASDFRVVVNVAKLRGDAELVVEGLSAAAATLVGTGRGQVLTSARKKLPGERGRALHGRGIANILMDRGKDVFVYDNTLANEVEAAIVEETNEAVADAYRTARPQRDRVRRVLRGGAIDLAADAAQYVKRGGLGAKKIRRTKRSGWRNYWARLAKLGRATLKYGNPPPLGIKTGRFVDGIRGFWTIGRGV